MDLKKVIKEGEKQLDQDVGQTLEDKHFRLRQDLLWLMFSYEEKIIRHIRVIEYVLIAVAIVLLFRFL